MSKVTNKTPADALAAAIKKVGSQAKLAAAIRSAGMSITQPAIYRWVNGGKGCSGKYTLTIEKITGISRHELCPTIYPVE